MYTIYILYILPAGLQGHSHKTYTFIHCLCESEGARKEASINLQNRGKFTEY